MKNSLEKFYGLLAVALLPIIFSISACSDNSSSADEFEKTGPFIVVDQLGYSVHDGAFVFTGGVCKEVGGELVWSTEGAQSQLRFDFDSTTNILKAYFNQAVQHYQFYGDNFPVGVFKGHADSSPNGFVVEKNIFKMVMFYDSKCMAQNFVDIGFITPEEGDVVECNTIKKNGMTTSFEPDGSSGFKIMISLGNVKCEASSIHILHPYSKDDCKTAYKLFKENDGEGTFSLDQGSVVNFENEECMADLAREAYLLGRKDARVFADPAAIKKLVAPFNMKF